MKYKKVQEYVIHDDFFQKDLELSIRLYLSIQKVSIKSSKNLEK